MIVLFIYSLLFLIGLLFFAGIAVGGVQIVFLLLSFGAGAYFCYRRKISDLVILIAWLLTLTPLFRRLNDVHVGYQDVSQIMLAPYIAMLWAAPYALATFRPKPVAWAFVAIFACCIYGLLFAIAGGRAVAGTFDFLRWILPPMVGLAIFQSPGELIRLRPKLLTFAVLFSILTSLYGIYQYVYVPRWDAEWMFYSRMGSIGTPQPFDVRVFSTLNSPGSYAGILLVTLVLLVGSGRTAMLIPVAIGVAAFGLTLVRASWIGFAIALVLIGAMGSWKARSNLTILAMLAVFSIPPLLVATGTDRYVGERFATLLDLRGDISLGERSSGYDQLLDNLNEAVFGRGLAVNGTAAQKSGEGFQAYIDGGPIEIFYALGLPVGLLYLATVIGLAALACLKGRREDTGARAALLVNVLLLTSSTVIAGEIGFFFWTLIGISLPRSRNPYRVSPATPLSAMSSLAMARRSLEHQQ